MSRAGRPWEQEILKGQPTLGERNFKGQWALGERHIAKARALWENFFFTDTQRWHKRIQSVSGHCDKGI